MPYLLKTTPVLYIALVGIFFCPGVFAQESGAPAQNNLDFRIKFNGVWSGIIMQPRQPDPADLPFTDAGRQFAETYDHLQDGIHNCLFDLGRITSVPFPLEVIVQEKQVTLIYEYGRQVRRIFLDRKDFSAVYPDNLMGYSIGRWEGETLVVKTEKILPGWTFMEGIGPYSDKMKMTEKYSLDDSGKVLTVIRTYDDPVYYTEPWSWTNKYSPSKWDIFPYDCEMGSIGSANDDL